MWTERRQFSPCWKQVSLELVATIFINHIQKICIQNEDAKQGVLVEEVPHYNK